MKQHYPRHPKSVVEAEKNAAVRVSCKAIQHAAKLVGRPIRDALKGKNSHYVQAFTGRVFTDREMQAMISQSTAHVSFSDQIKEATKVVEIAKNQHTPNKNRRNFKAPAETTEVDGFVIRNY